MIGMKKKPKHKHLDSKKKGDKRNKDILKYLIE